MKKQKTRGVRYSQIGDVIRQSSRSNPFCVKPKRSPSEKVHRAKDDLAPFGRTSRMQDSYIEDTIRRRSASFDAVKFFKLK